MEAIQPQTLLSVKTRLDAAATSRYGVTSHSLTQIRKHQSLQVFVRTPDSCRNRWKEEERHCHYFKSLYPCLSKWQATFLSEFYIDRRM